MPLKKEDIFLVLPPKRWKEHRYSLGLLYVSSYLRDNGFDNIIIERGLFKKEFKEYNYELARKLLIEKIKELKPKIVGFTVTVQEFDEVIELNRELKKEFNFISIVGGPQATAKHEDFLQNGFDLAVVGEGEETALELVKILEKIDAQENWKQRFLENITQIKGIAYKNEKGEIIKNENRAFIDINDLILPAYDKIDMESYVKMWDGIVRGFPVRGALILTSRGCPYDCSFCDCNKVFGRVVRFRGLENIKAEVKLLKEKYDIEGIWLADDTFTLNREHILGVGKIMKEFDLIWGCQARVNLIEEDLIKQMKRDGCIQFDLGVESGSQRILDKVMNKRINLEQVRKAFAICRKYKIRTLANLMMGLPTETKEEMEQTMQLARELKANFFVFSIFTPLPGTAIFDKYYKNEITNKDYKELNFFAGLEKYNKSEVKNLKELNTKWRKELAIRMKKENINGIFLFIKIFFKLKRKKERLNFIFNKIKNLIVVK
jgi:radical SAM superfamily enzyme YgiQ (UPF0313 family)